jgi:K+-sensing histidine kinase KdpD
MIFEAWQPDTLNNRRYDGLGLGLIISKAIIEALNGTIGIHSEVGKGSAFWFEIPLPQADNKPVQSPVLAEVITYWLAENVKQ